MIPVSTLPTHIPYPPSSPRIPPTPHSPPASLHSHRAQEQHDAKSKLEERYLVERKETLLAKRQDCRIALAERMRDRQALEHEAGQLKARKRDSVRQQVRAPPWLAQLGGK